MASIRRIPNEWKEFCKIGRHIFAVGVGLFDQSVQDPTVNELAQREAHDAGGQILYESNRLNDISAA